MSQPHSPARPLNLKLRAVKFILGGVLLLGLLTAGAGWRWLNLPAAAERDDEIIFPVSKGSGAGRIAADLRQAGLLDSEYAFRLAVWLRGAESGLKAGEYSIRPGASAWELVTVMLEGRSLLYRVVLPEGFNLEQIIGRLAQPLSKPGGGELIILTEEEGRRLAGDRDFLASLGLSADSLEGYIFPDTYFFTSQPGDARGVLTRLAERFRQVWEDLPPYQGDLALNRHQLLTLASIIEKETGLDEERPLVSAVYHNRLRLGMPLQADPTVLYGTGHQGAISRRLLQTDHPYNTYTRPGLPPGPICSPGRASLAAALQPAETNYLYFVASDKRDGSHNFTVRHEDHLKNVRQYRRGH
ncbi:MAG: endolytic transglycosylase MltG [Desulfarculales bacterium]|jgi:UPF0755 protein|nr:endolytic transglycosylase MltG [Desulfarculales bacterium]